MAFSTNFDTGTAAELQTITGIERTKQGDRKAVTLDDTTQWLQDVNADGGTGDAYYSVTGTGSPHADGNTDHYMEVTVRDDWATETDANNNFWCVRLVDEANFIGINVGGVGSSGMDVTEYVGGSIATVHYQKQAAADKVVRLEVVGNTLELFLNGASQGTATITNTATFSSETTTGLVVSGAAPAIWRNMETGSVPVIDNVDTDDVVGTTQTNWTINGSGFGAD